MPQVKGCRRFCVFTTPHLADPSWVNPVIEMQDSSVPGERPATVEYQDAEELIKVAVQLKADIARSAGYNAGAHHVLHLFGISFDEYIAAEKAAAAAGRVTVTPTEAEPEKPVDKPPTTT